MVAGVVHGDEAADPQVEDLLVRRARVLRDSGVEVIWAGPGLRSEQVAAIAVSEDVDGVEVAPGGAIRDVIAALTSLEVDDVEVAGVGEGDLTHG